MAKTNKNNKKKEQGRETRAIASRGGGELVPRMEREFDRMSELFDRMVEEIWKRPLPRLGHPFRTRRGGEWLMGSTQALDLYEDENELVVKGELPGLTKEDVEVSVSDSRLTIKGEKKKEEEIKDENYAYSERSYGAFTRSLDLPCEVEPDRIKASFKNGVLEIKLPKSEEAKKTIGRCENRVRQLRLTSL